MGHPIHPLPVVQNWDCHVCGTCCQEYLVTVTDEERQRVLAQGWDAERDLGGHTPFRRLGMWPGSRRWVLNHRPDGSCVFLSDQGRCRIHERFGYDTKPLPCRLFPFVLIPTGDHWRVGIRFACPSAAANKGRPLAQHDPALLEFAAQLAKREGLTPRPDGALTPPPRFDGGRRLPWPDLLRIVDCLVEVIGNRKDALERRWRKVLALTDYLRAADLRNITGGDLGELLRLYRTAVDNETPRVPHQVPSPTWVGRVLFRQAAALYTRKDHGPNRGLAGQGRLALLRAALQFARGTGPVPRMHRLIPEATFEQAETPRGPLPNDAENLLERYYQVKLASLQFCGAASFGLSFLEGIAALAVTVPVIFWTTRLFVGERPEAAVERALTIVDDHFGFNRVLASLRQRLSFLILAQRGELSRLIAWYGR
jgi:lysine-N-methylase